MRGIGGINDHGDGLPANPKWYKCWVCSLSIQCMISVQEYLTSNVEYEMGEKRFEIAKEYEGGEVILSRISPT